MTEATPASRFVCRFAAGLLLLVVLCSIVLASLVAPPVLERHVLVDGEIGTLAAAVATLWALGLFAVAIVAGVAAYRLAARADRIPARSVQLAAQAGAVALGLALVSLEALARFALEPSETLSGDAFWIQRRLERPRTEIEFPMNRFDAELGWAPREGYRSEGVTVNSVGARGRAEYATPKPRGIRRIVVLGDSFSFGEGVADADTYPSQLERLLADAEVVNLGVLGFGTDQQLLRLRRSAFGFDPDLIVLGFFGPNVERNVLSFRDAPKPRFVLAGDGIALVNSPVPGPDRVWESPQPLLRGVALLQKLGRRLLDRTRFAPQWEITRRILDAIADDCAARGVPLLVAFYPNRPTSFMDRPGDAEIVVENWARRRNANFFSMRPAFAGLPPEQQAKVYSGHWTPFGNGVVAERLAEEISRLGFERAGR